MKVINKSVWNTRDLKRVFHAVLNRWNEIDNRKVSSKRLRHITVVNSRFGYLSGHAYLNSGYMRLRLPKTHISVKETGWLFEHELAHCAGYEHKNMGPLNHWAGVKHGRYDYLEGIVIRPKEAKPAKPKGDAQIIRYQAAVEAEKRWRTKLKRAQTGVKTYRDRIKRYEKIFAADGRLAAVKKRD